MIAFVQLNIDLLISGSQVESQRERPGQLDFSLIQERGGMARARDNTASIRIEQHSDAGGEPAPQSPMQALIDLGQHLGGLGRKFGQGPDRADDERYGHGRLQSFAADVAQDN